MPRAAIVWSVLTVAVLVGALVWSVGSFTSTHVAPLALGSVRSGNSIAVTVSSGTDAGPYRLLRINGPDTTVIASDIHVGPDTPFTVELPMPNDSREIVRLVATDSSTPLRDVIIDTRTTDPKAAG